MASKWTDEQTRKLRAACEEAKKSGTIVVGSDEYWDCVVNNVGDGKTVKDCKDMCEKITKAFKDVNRLASTWTNEEIRKFKAAFEAGDPDLDTTEFWDYMTKEVGGSKTAKDCKELFMKGAIHASKDSKPKNEK